MQSRNYEKYSLAITVACVTPSRWDLSCYRPSKPADLVDYFSSQSTKSWQLRTVTIPNAPVKLIPRGQAEVEAKNLSPASDSASKIVLGFGLEHLSSACPRTFYFGLVKMRVVMELVITVSLQ